MARLCLGDVNKGDIIMRKIKDCGGIKPYNPVKAPETETTRKRRVANKKMSKKEIMKKLENPNLSNVERNELMEKLYEGIEFKKNNNKGE